MNSAGLLRVENTGRVYSPEAAARLTEAFYRPEARTAHAGGAGGNGLGLALVAQVVALHNGTLTITPRDGGGLIVDAALPLA